MSGFYGIAGVSKQAHQQYMVKLGDERDRTAYYVGLMSQARSLHPVIGLGKIYYLYRPEGIGRQAFERLGKLAGYALETKPELSWKGHRVIPYQNLLRGKRFNGLNQVWATDVTYYQLGDRYYYISMILDLYSRLILACLVADSLHAVHSIKVLKTAIRVRQIRPGTELIHHSDKGTQYTSNEYVGLLKRYQIGISMCSSVYENTHMERLNGIIKNDYLIHWKPRSFSHLKTLLAKAVTNYNNCPHGQLQMMSPVQYEQHLQNVPLSQRTPMEVFTFQTPKNRADSNQLQLFEPNLFVNQKGQPNPG